MARRRRQNKERESDVVNSQPKFFLFLVFVLDAGNDFDYFSFVFE